MAMRHASGAGGGRARAHARRAAAVAASAGLVLGVAAGTGAVAGAASKAPSGTLDIANFVPFSGTNASFGPLALSGCYPAAYAINKAGGVLGHKLSCTSVDDRGDPADAVPAANALVAHDGNVVAVFGPSSTTALATTPTLFSAHLPTFLMAGDAKYDHTTNAYMWRFTPPDAAEGWAMAAYAREKHFTKAASVFATTAQVVGGATSSTTGFKKLGGKVVANISITSGQPSYSTEAEQLANAHPQVIFLTAPASTAATFLGELKQLMGTLPPAYVSEVAEEPGWLSAVGGAIGATALSKDVAFETGSPSTSSPGWKAFHQAITKDPQKVSDISQYFQDPFTLSYYDAANLVALAMVQAKSTKPAVFDKHILAMTEPGSGKVVVHTFAAGERAIKAGKSIEYVGADGRLDVNKYHNVAGQFVALTEGNKPKRLGIVSQKLIDKAAL